MVSLQQDMPSKYPNSYGHVVNGAISYVDKGRHYMQCTGSQLIVALHVKERLKKPTTDQF